jgi:hypothetical protein
VLHTDHWVEISRILHGNAVRELIKDKFGSALPESAATAADRLPQRVRRAGPPCYWRVASMASKASRAVSAVNVFRSGLELGHCPKK